MRNALMRLVIDHAVSDPNVLFITGDLGFSVVEELRDTIGDRFINAGIAEQNMMTMAAALASCGYMPYVYSIAPFVTARCFEQLRNDVCYHHHKVLVIGTGAGLSYGSLGPSHHSLEDAAILSTLPGMSVLSPSNGGELAVVHGLAISSGAPAYFRIPRESGPEFGVPSFSSLDTAAHLVAPGQDVVLVATGPAVTTALSSRMELANVGISAAVVSVPVLAPFPSEAILQHLPGNVPVLAVFEGYTGGPLELGLRRALMARGTLVQFGEVAIPMRYPRLVGNTEYLRSDFGIDARSVAAAARRLIAR